MWGNAHRLGNPGLPLLRWHERARQTSLSLCGRSARAHSPVGQKITLDDTIEGQGWEEEEVEEGHLFKDSMCIYCYEVSLAFSNNITKNFEILKVHVNETFCKRRGTQTWRRTSLKITPKICIIYWK